MALKRRLFCWAGRREISKIFKKIVFKKVLKEF
jgi:hypothetical protein